MVNRGGPISSKVFCQKISAILGTSGKIGAFNDMGTGIMGGVKIQKIISPMNKKNVQKFEINNII